LSQLSNPDQRIITEDIANHKLIERYAISKRGIVNGDNEKWLRKCWEILTHEAGWRKIQLAVNKIIGSSHISGE
jgi:hypothetical protein